MPNTGRINIFSNKGKSRKSVFNLTGLENISDSDSEKSNPLITYKGSQLASLFSPDEELVVLRNPSIKDIVQKAIQSYEVYVKQSVSEIMDLRREIGELQWTNRELKMAVKQKAKQNGYLLDQIEQFEEVLKKQQTKSAWTDFFGVTNDLPMQEEIANLRKLNLETNEKEKGFFIDLNLRNPFA